MAVRVIKSILTGIYATRVANCLFDLGIDVSRIGPACGYVLHEIEMNRRGDFSPQEAAAYFLGGVFSNLPLDCYLVPMTPLILANRARDTIAAWVKKGKMRAAWEAVVLKNLSSQI